MRQGRPKPGRLQCAERARRRRWQSTSGRTRRRVVCGICRKKGMGARSTDFNINDKSAVSLRVVCEAPGVFLDFRFSFE